LDEFLQLYLLSFQLALQDAQLLVKKLVLVVGADL
jgi:hypothetical protein